MMMLRLWHQMLFSLKEIKTLVLFIFMITVLVVPEILSGWTIIIWSKMRLGETAVGLIMAPTHA